MTTLLTLTVFVLLAAISFTEFYTKKKIIRALEDELRELKQVHEWVKHQANSKLEIKGQAAGWEDSEYPLSVRESRLYFHSWKIKSLVDTYYKSAVAYRSLFLAEFKKNPANKNKLPVIDPGLQIPGHLMPTAGFVKIHV